MEVVPVFLARLFACLSVLTLAHLIGRRWETTGDSEETVVWDLRSFPPIAILFFALAWLPVFDLGFVHYAAEAAGSLIGVWVLLQVVRVFPGATEGEAAQDWLSTWGFALASPVSVFAQWSPSGMAGAQNRLLGELVPAWGIWLQPVAFLLALYAICQWSQSVPAPSLSLRRKNGAALGVVLITTVIVFMGAWHVPWVGEDALFTYFGGRRIFIALFQLLFFTLKLSLLWLAVLGLNRRLKGRDRLPSPLLCSALAAANLVLTWALLAGMRS